MPRRSSPTRNSLSPWPGEDPSGLPGETEIQQAWRVVLTAVGLPRICPREACQRGRRCMAEGFTCLQLDEDTRRWVADAVAADMKDRFGPVGRPGEPEARGPGAWPSGLSCPSSGRR